MNNKVNTVHNNYDALNPFQKKITQLFAISGEPIKLNQAYNMLNRLRVRPDNIALSIQTLEINCLELLNSQILSLVEKSKFSINPIIENIAVRDLYSSNLFENYTRVLNQFFPLEGYSIWDRSPIKRYYSYIRIALLNNNSALVNSLIRSGQRKYKEFDSRKIYNILVEPFDERWLSKLSESLINSIFVNGIDELLSDFTMNKPFFDFIENHKLDVNNSNYENYLNGIKWRYLLEGRLDKLDELNKFIQFIQFIQF